MVRKIFVSLSLSLAFAATACAVDNREPTADDTAAPSRLDEFKDIVQNHPEQLSDKQPMSTFDRSEIPNPVNTVLGTVPNGVQADLKSECVNDISTGCGTCTWQLAGPNYTTYYHGCIWCDDGDDGWACF